MAAEKKQKKMVLQDKGVAAPSPVCFPVLRPGKRHKESSLAEGIPVINKEADMMARSSVFSAKDIIKVSAMVPVEEHIPNSTTHPDLSPDSICKGIKVTLDNNKLWNEFFRCQTEMIVTAQGSRMFPYCRFRISGLEPSKKYSLIMDIHPMDNYRYKWTGQNWHLAGKSERHIKSRPFSHPDSPSTGQHWMQNPVSFYRLKLTNNITEHEGNVVLHALHRYLPRLYVVPLDKATAAARLSGPHIVTFTFPQTEFFAVTAFQNSRFAQLKVDCNPFAKGLKEDGSTSFALKLKSNPSKDSNKHQGSASQEHPVRKNLKSLLENHKPRSSKLLDQKHFDQDAEKATPTERDQSPATDPEKKSCNTCPKLFSELIREAHISLKRCNLEHMSIGSGTVGQGETTDDKDSGIKGKEKALSKASLSSKTLPEGSSTRTGKTKGKTSATNKKMLGSSKEDKHLSCSVVNEKSATISDSNSKMSLSSSVDSESKSKTDACPEENGKPHKRPAPVPLPALARFLKQHRIKPKNARIRPESPTALPSESLSHSTQPPASLATSNLLGTNSSDLDNQLSKDLQTAKGDADFPGQVAIFTPNRWDSAVSSPHPEMPYAASELPGSDQGFYTSRPSSASPTLSQTHPLSDSTGAATLASKGAMLLDPETSPFGFEPLSPDGSPEPFPGLSASVTLEASPSILQPASKPVPPQQMSYSENSAMVLKWPSVLPLPDPFISAFTYQQIPAPQFPSSVIESSQRSPPLSLSHTVPQASGHSSSPVPSFQDSDHSLPFPGELSPLALQLPLSPTFSSLDGGGLSPTPSLTDLIRIIGNDDDNLEMEEAFPNTDVALDLCPPSCTVSERAQSPAQPAQLPATKKTQTTKKKHRPSRAARVDQAGNDSDASYASMKPSLEEVEEQLFVSFTSKEALRLHTVEPSENRLSPSHPPLEQPQQMPEATQNAETPESLEDRIGALETVLLKDLKLMKHRQVIHPVLQEVGLKLSLLDPTLAIDLQYLGVCLPLPPPGICLELLSESLASTQTVSAAFVSRTGKTTDVTQIKGWRDKYANSESSSPPLSAKPEALSLDSASGPSSDVPTKNLSAFCSDMLDEYLENEAKLIDERAASFSQAPFEAVSYELPTIGSSYIRTLDSLKKQPLATPTSALISSFVPPSKRPRLPSMGPKKVKGDKKQKPVGSKPNKPGDSHVIDSGCTVGAPAPTNTTHTPPSADSTPDTQIPNQDTLKKKKKKNKLKLQMLLARSDTALETQPPNYTLKKKRKSEMPLAHSKAVFKTLPSNNDALKKKHKSEMSSDLCSSDTVLKTHPLNVHTLKKKKKKKLKDKASEQTTTPTLTNAVPPGISQDMAPLESDSELLTADDPSDKTSAKPLVTKALLKLKDLEDGVVWEGKPQTCITEERAAIALASLFTLVGFAREDPTAPIQLIRRRAPPCLNDFCRLGCVCSSLMQSRRLTHCGKALCMFGCSCLRQKVVLLKHLDALDSDQGDQVKKKRRKRMKMAYVLKDAEPVAQPSQSSQLLRTLWRKEPGDADPEPLHTTHSVLFSATATAVQNVGCARVRGYQGRKTLHHSSSSEKVSSCQSTENQTQSPVWTDAPLKKTKKMVRSANVKPPTGGTAGQIQPAPAPAPAPVSPEPSPSPSPSKRLTILAECRWSGSKEQNLVLREVCRAMAQDRLQKPFMVQKYLVTPICQYKDSNNCLQYKVHISAGPSGPEQNLQETEQQDPDQNLQGPERRDGGEEALPDVEDWQRAVEEGDFLEEDEKEENRSPDEGGKTQKMKMKVVMKMGLPFLTGISPAGFLRANRKEPAGTSLPVQVNGKAYPLAKIQLGGMGALHPANRLAAFLTGRVAQFRKLPAPSPAPSPPCPSLPVPLALTTPTATDNAVTVGPRARGPDVLVIKATPTGVSPVNPSPVTIAPARPKVLLLPGGAAPASIGQKMALSSLAGQVTADPGGQQGAPATYKTASGKLYMKMADAAPGRQRVVLAGQATASPVGQRGAPSTSRPASGKLYMKMADGKLVQLVPLSQLRASNPGLVLQTNTTSTPSTGIQTFRPVSTATGPSLLSQKDTCRLQIVPPGNKQPITVVCPKVPTKPRVFTLLQPPASYPTKTPEALCVEDQKEASPGQSVGGALSSLASKQQVQEAEDSDSGETDVSDDPLSQPPETCGTVEDQKEASLWCVGRGQEQEETEDFDSSDTEVSDNPCRLNDVTDKESRHNLLEKNRRDEQNRKFDRLREELHLLPKTAKVTILKQAQKELRVLMRTRRRQQRRRKMLKKERKRLLATLSQLTQPSSKAPAEECAPPGAPPRHGEVQVVHLLDSGGDVMTINTDEEVEVLDVEGNRGRRCNDDPQSANYSSGEDEDSRVEEGFRSLRSVLGVHHEARLVLLQQACRGIHELREQTDKLEKERASLSLQRDAYIRKISHRSSKNPGIILRKVEDLSAKQKEVEECHGSTTTTTSSSSLPPGGATTTPASYMPTPGSATTSTTISLPVPEGATTSTTISLPVPEGATTSTTISWPAIGDATTTTQHTAPVTRLPHPQRPAPPPAPTDAPWVKKRPRTRPNILCHRKPAPRTGAPAHPVLVPAEFLTLVAPPLAGSPLLALRPLAAAPVRQAPPAPGMTSVILNLTNQHLSVPSVSCPPAVQVYSTAALLATPTPSANLTAGSRPSLLPLAPPTPTPSLLLSAPPRREGEQRASREPTPCSSAQQEVQGEESLKSLLSEIVFLSQGSSQLGQEEAPPGGGGGGGGGGGPGGHNEDLTESRAEPNEALGGSPCAATGEVLAPPPLTQMRLGAGGVVVVEPANEKAGDGEGGVAWRPMPRLVPLGAKPLPPAT